MKILILEAEQYQVISKDKPEIGKSYLLEDAVLGSSQQNKAFHSLINAFWFWMFKTNTFKKEDDGIIYDLSTPDQWAFKDFFKYRYGEGFTHYQYVNDKFEMVKVKSMNDIPGYVIDDFNSGTKGRVKGVLKSWTQYSKKQRMKCIDMLLLIISIFGCTDAKVEEIISGMEWNSNNKE